MMILNLARGNSGMRVPLRLPATPDEIHTKLDQISAEEQSTRIASVVSEVSFIDRYFRDLPMTRSGDYFDLNELARRLDQMDARELCALDGALNAECVSGIPDILRIADSLENYIFVNGVTTEKELGRFLVDSGYKDFPESVRPYLDYTAIGTEYYAERGGAFTAEGYTLRRSAAEQTIAMQRNKPLFRVCLQTEEMQMLGNEPIPLTLPTYSGELERIKNALHVDSLAEVRVSEAVCFDSRYQKYIPLDDSSVASLIDLSNLLTDADHRGELRKALSILAMERPKTLEDAIGLVRAADEYTVVQGSEAAYGMEALLNLCGDQEVIDTIDGFMNWHEFGCCMMEQDGVIWTEFESIRKNRPQLESQNCELQMAGY